MVRPIRPVLPADRHLPSTRPAPPADPRLPQMTTGTEERLQRALDLAYAYLNRRDRTVEEVRRQLERKGISEDVREAAISTLIDQRFLDDERFARLYVSDKRTLEQWGADRIRRGLLARGLDRERIDQALADAESEAIVESGESELDRAVAVLRRRFPEPPVDRRERERALGVLLRKGYDGDLALDALTAHARGD